MARTHWKDRIQMAISAVVGGMLFADAIPNDQELLAEHI
jgi:hypothetical protein